MCESPSLLQLIAGKRRSGADAPEDLSKVLGFAPAQAGLKRGQSLLVGNLCRHLPDANEAC
jgi:hypothetical protein